MVSREKTWTLLFEIVSVNYETDFIKNSRDKVKKSFYESTLLDMLTTQWSIHEDITVHSSFYVDGYTGILSDSIHRQSQVHNSTKLKHNLYNVIWSIQMNDLHSYKSSYFIQKNPKKWSEIKIKEKTSWNLIQISVLRSSLENLEARKSKNNLSVH